VPQLEQWLRAWRYVKNPTSLRAAECIQGTEAFLAGNQSAVAVASRKALAAMYEIMAEAVKEEKREWLRSAVAICIMIDDRDAYRICRFRCIVGVCSARPDAGAASSQPDGRTSDVGVSTSGSCVSKSSASEAGRDAFTRDGLLCTLRRGGESSSASMDTYQADYSSRMCDSIVHAIRALCTPLGDTCDEQLVSHILDHIFTYVSDGAAPAMKCGRLLTQHCTNLAWILRDPAHAVRTAAESPIQLVDCFASFWEDVFDKRHALVPDVQNSDAWRSKLMAAERHIVAEKGTQGARVETVLRHLSFAKQRFDSCVAPSRKVCIMLTSLTLLLIGVACDWRADSDMRKRAQKQLDALTPCRITSAGLFADYTAMSISFVRLFDADYDIACVNREKLNFLRRMKLLFIDGHALTAGSARVDGHRELGQHGETMTQVAIAQAKEFGTVYFSDRAFSLWPAGAERDATRAVASMSAVVTTMTERVEAELHKDSILLQFAAFDLATWQSGVTLLTAGKRDCASQLFGSQIRRAKTLARAHKVINQNDVSAGVDNFAAIAKFLCKAHRTEIAKREMDNRVAWVKVLSGTAPPRYVCDVVQHLVAWYISVN
jgi:hypothetical protein